MALPSVSLLVGLWAATFDLLTPAGWSGLMVGGWGLAIWAYRSERERRVTIALALAFVGAGGALMSHRLSGESNGRTAGSEAVAGTFAPDPVLLEGRLRADARTTSYGANLVLEVDRAAGTATGTPLRVHLGVGGERVLDRVSEWRAGRQVRVTAALKAPVRYRNFGLDEQGAHHRGPNLIGSVKSALLVDVVAPGPWVSEVSAALRAWIRTRVDRAVGRWSAASAGIVTAILIGDRAGLSDETARRLREAGTFHVIAISGGNIAILAGLLLGVARAVRLPARGASSLTALCLIAYAYLVGADASVVRATLVAVTYLMARLLDHRTPPLNAIALAGAVGLLSEPLSVYDVGFAFTFGATLAILLGAGPLARVLARWAHVERLRGSLQNLPNLVFGLAAATICAELAIFPISALAFSQVSTAGLLLNFLAIPFMTLVQIAGLVAVAIDGMTPALGGAVGFAAHLGARGLTESTRFVELAPWLVRRVPSPALLTVALYYAGWIVWMAASRSPVVRRVAGLVSVATAAVMLVPPIAGLPGRFVGAPGCGDRDVASCLTVTFLDVGQGDATLVRFPGGQTLLVDAGGAPASGFDVGERIVVPGLWALGIRRLDYLALSHGDPDHIGGAPALVRQLRPREIWEGVPVPGHAALEAVAAVARTRGVMWRTLQTGDRLAEGGAELQVWHPPPPDWERPRVRNNDSLVFELRLGEVAIWLCGDVGHEVERRLATGAVGDRPAVTVLKVPHHGSTGSSAPVFLEAIRPAVAVVSAGRGNRYGHPTREVLERYRAIGAKVFRTDRDGAIRVETDGQTVWTTTVGGARLVSEANGPSLGVDEASGRQGEPSQSPEGSALDSAAGRAPWSS